MPGDPDKEPLARSSFGREPDSLLQLPSRVVGRLEKEVQAGEPLPEDQVALLPTFLRTFFLRFLDQEAGLRIGGFTADERQLVSDIQVDWEIRGEREEAWPLLYDFIDLCDRFEDIGLMSVPEEAGEYETDILDRTAQVLQDLASWADKVSLPSLETKAAALAHKLEQINRRHRR